MSSYIDISQKLVSSSELELGMFVSRLDRPWEETPFIFQGFLISNQEEIYQLQQYCKRVHIDVKQTVEIKHNRGQTSTKKRLVTLIQFHLNKNSLQQLTPIKKPEIKLIQF